jgi:hypothetical protein
VHSATDFFVTGAGLMGTETSIAGFSGYDTSKAPEFYRARKAMQYGDTLDGAIDLLKTSNNGGYANSWLLGSAHTGKIARLEMGLRFVGETRSSDGYFWGCNLVEDVRIRNQECTGIDYCNINDDAARRVRWQSLLQDRRGQVDLDLARSFVADHWYEYTHVDAPSARTICGRFDEFPDTFPSWGFGPYEPFGANDGKVTNSRLALELGFVGRMGRPCGQFFSAARFLSMNIRSTGGSSNGCATSRFSRGPSSKRGSGHEPGLDPVGAWVGGSARAVARRPQSTAILWW